MVAQLASWLEENRNSHPFWVALSLSVPRGLPKSHSGSGGAGGTWDRLGSGSVYTSQRPAELLGEKIAFLAQRLDEELGVTPAWRLSLGALGAVSQWARPSERAEHVQQRGRRLRPEVVHVTWNHCP